MQTAMFAEMLKVIALKMTTAIFAETLESLKHLLDLFRKAEVLH
jgi:hypothetical protein